MRLVHFSDVHLGYRQYQRLTPTGINQREWDVARTFQRAIDKTMELAPELVLIAGDLFHTARPSNAAILHAFRQFLRLRTAIPETKIVLIAGNHDTPRTSETGSILGLFEQLGLELAIAGPRRIEFPDLDLAVLAVPDVPGGDAELTPDDAFSRNVLVMHADVEDVMPRYQAELDRAAIRVTRAGLRADRWSYIGLGHYHVHQKIERNAFYSGSLDYTSLNVWADLSEEDEHGVDGKGLIEFDLEKGVAQFHPLARSRDFVMLREISARNKSVAEIDAAIARAVERFRGGIDDKVVRLVVTDIPRHVARELDHKALREYKRRALSFHLITRRPDERPRRGQGAPGRRPSVADVVRQNLETRELPADLERPRLIELGMKYLDEAEALYAPPAAVAVAEAEK